MLHIGFFAVIMGCLGLFWSSPGIHAAEEIPMGPTYHRPKCVIAVGDLAVLFESLRFNVLDRLDPKGFGRGTNS